MKRVRNAKIQRETTQELGKIVTLVNREEMDDETADYYNRVFMVKLRDLPDFLRNEVINDMPEEVQELTLKQMLEIAMDPENYFGE